VRFASVYRNFREAKDFTAAVENLSVRRGTAARDREEMSFPRRAFQLRVIGFYL